jgi:hypothetical protein
MLKVLPAIEGYVLANIATQNLFGGNPLQFVLGDLNTTAAPAGSNALALAMGPQPGVISLKELLTGSMNTATTTYTSTALNRQQATTTVTGGVGGVFDAVSANFQQNLGNILVGTAMSTAGFRVAKRVLRKPINMANKQLRMMGLGSTVQF